MYHGTMYLISLKSINYPNLTTSVNFNGTKITRCDLTHFEFHNLSRQLFAKL